MGTLDIHLILIRSPYEYSRGTQQNRDGLKMVADFALTHEVPVRVDGGELPITFLDSFRDCNIESLSIPLERVEEKYWRSFGHGSLNVLVTGGLLGAQDPLLFAEPLKKAQISLEQVLSPRDCATGQEFAIPGYCVGAVARWLYTSFDRFGWRTRIFIDPRSAVQFHGMYPHDTLYEAVNFLWGEVLLQKTQLRLTPSGISDPGDNGR
ncbi:hypothetical protein HYV84_00030 [Candidatus Woesearchaeota archaeon]|nr:hypothetical protein [Candidatus Woesearchaeota archaeon]